MSEAHLQAQPFDWHSIGPIYSTVSKTLEEGERTEILGPLVHSEAGADKFGWGVCPLFTFREDKGTDSSEFDFLYPILTVDRFGKEYRFQIGQAFSISHSGTQNDQEKKKFTLFPIYFQQRSPDPAENYTAFVPFYGHLKNRLFRDDVRFIMLPLYLESRKRDIVTENYLFPFFDVRHGNGLEGWQVWPFIGREHKEVTTFTNRFEGIETVPGHDKLFVLWPFYFNNTLGIGSTNTARQFGVLPFYTSQTSPGRDSKTIGFPLGYTKTVDRDRKYTEWDAPMPFIVFARGEGKTVNRVWPFYSHAKNANLESDFYLWPIYKCNRITVSPYYRQRIRILFYLYSDVIEKNETYGTTFAQNRFLALFHEAQGTQWQHKASDISAAGAVPAQ